MPVINTHRTNTYVIDTAGGAEIARLMNQSQLLTRSMGGVFPELAEELANMHSILDLACGPVGRVKSRRSSACSERASAAKCVTFAAGRSSMSRSIFPRESNQVGRRVQSSRW